MARVREPIKELGHCSTKAKNITTKHRLKKVEIGFFVGTKGCIYLQVGSQLIYFHGKLCTTSLCQGNLVFQLRYQILTK